MGFYHSLLNIPFDFNYLPLLIIILSAWLIPILLSIFRLEKLPSVIIEIIVGFFIGHYLLHLFSPEAIVALDVLALSGFIFLMFLGGLEIDVDQLFASIPQKKITTSRFIKNPLLVGLTFFISSIILSYFGTLALSKVIEIKSIWYFSLIMVTTSVGIILPVLKSRGEISSRFGQMLIVAAAIADIFSIILFSFTAFIIKNGFKSEVLLIFGLFLAFFLFSRIGLKLTPKPRFKSITYNLEHAASQIQVRGTLLIILIFVVLAQFIGEETILLGAFLSGILLSIFLHKGRSIHLVKLDGIGYGFFIPIFFLMVGFHFDTSALKELDNSIFLFLGLLLITLFLVKVIPSFLWSRLFGIKRAISGGFLMSSRLSLIIAASKIGLDLEIISPAINSSFILMAVLTCLFSPLLYNLLNPLDSLSGDKIIIVGGSSSGVLLARRLKIHSKTSIIIENSKNRYLEMLSKGLKTHLGCAFNAKTYEEIKLHPNNYVVVMTGNEKSDIRVCELLRKEFQHERVITKADNRKFENKLKILNVEFIDVRRIIAATIENLIMRPATYHTLIESFDDFSVEEIKIKNKYLNGIAIKEIPFHKDGSLMLIRRGYNIFIPHGDTCLKADDLVTVLGTMSAVEDFRNTFLN
jgi:Kef-type K+ transport system membrane component KefB